MAKTVGSGLTRYLVKPVLGPEGLEKAGADPQWLASALPTYPERLLAWRQWATGVLSKAGRPTTRDLVVVAPDGTWKRANLMTPGRVVAGLSYSDDEEEASIEWFASKVLMLIDHELDILRPSKRLHSSKSRAASKPVAERRLIELSSRGTACELGATIERIRWKFRHEEAALAGYRQKESIAQFQKAGAKKARQRGQLTEDKIKPLFESALSRSKKPTNALGTEDILRLIKRIDRKKFDSFKEGTLRRHVDRLRKRLQAAK